jgi:hypothetical protein
VIRSGSMFIVNDYAINDLWSCKSCVAQLLIRFKNYSLFMLGSCLEYIRIWYPF